MLTLSASPFARATPAPAPRASAEHVRPSKSRRPTRSRALPAPRVGPATISKECYGLSLFGSCGHYHTFAAEMGNQP